MTGGVTLPVWGRYAACSERGDSGRLRTPSNPRHDEPVSRLAGGFSFDGADLTPSPLTWQTYTAHVLQSLPADGPGRDPLVLHARLVGELGELADASTSPARVLEAGDVLFFVAALERVLMLDLGSMSAVYATYDAIPHAFISAARIGQMLAKNAEHGDPVDLDRVRALLDNIRNRVFCAVAATTPAEVMAANARKLDAKWGRV